MWIYFLSISLTRPLATLCTISNWRWPVLSPRCGPWALYKREKHIWLCFQGYMQWAQTLGSWVDRNVEWKLSSLSIFFLLLSRCNNPWSITSFPTKLYHVVRNNDDDRIVMTATVPKCVRHWAKCCFQFLIFIRSCYRLHGKKQEHRYLVSPQKHFNLKKVFKW